MADLTPWRYTTPRAVTNLCNENEADHYQRRYEQFLEEASSIEYHLDEYDAQELAATAVPHPEAHHRIRFACTKCNDSLKSESNVGICEDVLSKCEHVVFSFRVDPQKVRRELIAPDEAAEYLELTLKGGQQESDDGLLPNVDDEVRSVVDVSDDPTTVVVWYYWGHTMFRVEVVFRVCMNARVSYDFLHRPKTLKCTRSLFRVNICLIDQV